MKNQTKNKTHTPKLALLTSILLIASACSTTKHRDERLVANLEKQNAVIDAATSDRESTEVKAEVEKSEALVDAEVRLKHALEAVKNANDTVIAKLKPETKKECKHEDEGDSDEQ